MHVMIQPLKTFSKTIWTYLTSHETTLKIFMNVISPFAKKRENLVFKKRWLDNLLPSASIRVPRFQGCSWYSKHMFSKSKFANCKYMKLQDSRSLYLESFPSVWLIFLQWLISEKLEAPTPIPLKKAGNAPVLHNLWKYSHFIQICEKQWIIVMWSIHSCCLSSGNYPHCTVTNVS